MRFPLALALLALLGSGCSSDTGAVPMAIRDPLALIDDVQGPLRLYVLPAESYSCEATTGFVSPDVPDVAEGMFADAVADLSLNVSDSRALTELEVLAGNYTVLVRGKGTDPVSGRTDVFIATACADTTIEIAETRTVALTLLPIVGSGDCGDGVLSPDEQCEDGGTADGDGCSATCRSEPVAINTTVAGGQTRPRASGAPGQRWLFSYDSDGQDVFLRVLESDLATVTAPSVRSMDAELDTVLPSPLIGAEFSASVAQTAAGRQAIAFVDSANGMTPTKVVFADPNIANEGEAMAVGSATATANPSVAFAGNGAALVVFEEPGSTTGLSGSGFAAASTTPGATFDVGMGASGATGAQIAGASDHFVVVFAAAGGVFVQRFEADGTARDAAAVMVAGGAASAPSVAALPDGRALIAWQDSGDVQARTMAADGTLGEPLVVNTSAGDQSTPSVATGNNVFVVAFQSGSGVRARVLSADGAPLPNRDAPPTTADFEVTANGSAPSVAFGGESTAPTWLAAYESGDDIQARAFPLP